MACSAPRVSIVHALSGSRGDTGDVVKAVSLATVVLGFLGAAFDISLVTARVSLAFWATAVLLVLSSRLVMRSSLAWVRRRGRNLRHLLIVGTNARARDMAGRIESRPDLGYRLIGFVDDDWDGMDAFHRAGYPLVTDVGGLNDFLRENGLRKDSRRPAGLPAAGPSRPTGRDRVRSDPRPVQR
jgi:hypothetical protein